MSIYAQVVRLKVKPEKVDEFLNVFKINYEGTRKEDGNIRFELLQSKVSNNEFVVFEVFASEEALAAHRLADHFKVSTGRFPELLESDRVIEAFTPVMGEYLPAT